MTEREKIFNLLTVICDPKMFKFNLTDKKVSIEMPLNPENVKYFRKSIFQLLGNPTLPQENWDADPLFHGYKIDSRYINIDVETLNYTKEGYISVNQESVVDTIENKVLDKLGIDIKNDEISLGTYNTFSKTSQKPFDRNTTSYQYTASGLDYSNPDNWFLFPNSVSGLLDVFILYPTTVYDETKETLIDISDVEMVKQVKLFLKEIMPIFKDLPVNLYMPKYRQINGVKIEKWSMEGFANTSEFVSCRNDIYNAFNYFLTECQSADQYITFSHDQGTILNYFLLTEFEKNITDSSKWKNAWCLGIGLDDTILNHTSFIASGLPTDTKTIISWNVATQSELELNRRTWGDGTSVCINPITFTKTYAEQIRGDNISLINYYKSLNPTFYQFKNDIVATVVANKWENEIVKIGFSEKEYLTKEMITKKDISKEGYFYNNTIGLFAENIRNNIIARYKLNV